MSLIEQALKKFKDARPGSAEVAAITRPEASAAAPIRPVEPVQRRNGAIVEIDRRALRAKGLYPPEAEERRLAAEYRNIKRPLIAGAFGKGGTKITNGAVIMVASPLPGDGKTFTTVNLALSMALEKDLTVLLVDADLAKPHISRSFGVENEPGLLDLLRDETIDAESLIRDTSVSGLTLLPAGQNVETATELLASNLMGHIVANLVKRDPNRIVLFDSPPLLLTSESRVLANVAGQVVVVVREGVTRQPAVLEALACFPEDKSVGIVLNQSHARSQGSYYGYGQYGEYGSSSDSSSS